MKKSNQFISGSDDSTMIIWENNNNQQWQCIQVLTSHTNTIWCITINKNENLLISGSYDKKIKFWQKQNNTWSCYQSINCQGCVNSLSLNEQDDKLIASVKDKILLIQQLNKGWMITQEISVDQSGDRLCYINQNQFVFQPAFQKHLQIFDFDTQDQTYKKGQELQLQDQVGWDDALFPIQYISKIGLIIVKNGCHVHLVKKNQNGQFTVEQSIHFNTPCIFGCMTDDGRFIATWDDEQQTIMNPNMKIFLIYHIKQRSNMMTSLDIEVLLQKSHNLLCLKMYRPNYDNDFLWILQNNFLFSFISLLCIKIYALISIVT